MSGCQCRGLFRRNSLGSLRNSGHEKARLEQPAQPAKRELTAFSCVAYVLVLNTKHQRYNVKVCRSLSVQYSSLTTSTLSPITRYGICRRSTDLKIGGTGSAEESQAIMRRIWETPPICHYCSAAEQLPAPPPPCSLCQSLGGIDCTGGGRAPVGDCRAA